jgi:hypothetical protein
VTWKANCWFSTSSSGGRNALGKLCRAFDRDHRKHPGEFPIIELGVESYQHDVYGKIEKPSFKIVGWAKWDEDENGDAVIEKPRLQMRADDPHAQTDAYLDDEIPF